MAALYTVTVAGPEPGDFAILDSRDPADLLAELAVVGRGSPRAMFTVAADPETVRRFIEFAAGASDE